jgi:DNA mismatch repair protein MutH
LPVLANPVAPTPPLRRAAPPTDLWQLLDRARALADCSLADLWQLHGDPRTPLPDLRRHKGLIGQLVESALGSSGHNDAAADLPHLFAPDGSPGIELKTVPLQPSGVPRESTWVTRLPMRGELPTFAESSVARKLACVLWLPIAPLPPGAEPASRRLLQPRLWQPDAQTWAQLAADYQTALEAIAAGQSEDLRGHLGSILQVRPKAANAAVRVQGWDADGQAADVLPLGFYLRPAFVGRVLQQAIPVGEVRRWG